MVEDQEFLATIARSQNPTTMATCLVGCTPNITYYGLFTIPEKQFGNFHKRNKIIKLIDYPQEEVQELIASFCEVQGFIADGATLSKTIATKENPDYSQTVRFTFSHMDQRYYPANLGSNGSGTVESLTLHIEAMTAQRDMLVLLNIFDRHVLMPERQPAGESVNS